MSYYGNPNNNDDAGFLLVILFIGALTYFLCACASIKQGSSGVFTHRPLIEQIIRPRTGHIGLTHKTCVQKNWFGECEKSEVVDYDLNDKAVRDRLINNAFRCKISGRRYKIHPDMPGFVRYESVRPCWLCSKETRLVEFMDVSQIQVLLDGATVCWSEKTYPNGLN